MIARICESAARASWKTLSASGEYCRWDPRCGKTSRMMPSALDTSSSLRRAAAVWVSERNCACSAASRCAEATRASYVGGGQASGERQQESTGSRNGHPMAPRKFVGAISEMVALGQDHFPAKIARDILVERVHCRVALDRRLFQRFDDDRVKVSFQGPRELLRGRVAGSLPPLGLWLGDWASRDPQGESPPRARRGNRA